MMMTSRYRSFDWARMQMRLSAFVKRDDEASKAGGQPFSHRAFGEVVAKALQVPGCCLATVV